ncbi:hypothetical protein CEXT_68991 [Caerostris extrusa]|uniref:Uncharacterized protein n=1 Tax=Caerostris extrusa TaxID=172846 RepID=A0AAV4TEG0_CAEEX|nr:hypothetical protein CEXT_68991 [Caerostris extrusa]
MLQSDFERAISYIYSTGPSPKMRRSTPTTCSRPAINRTMVQLTFRKPGAIRLPVRSDEPLLVSSRKPSDIRHVQEGLLKTNDGEMGNLNTNKPLFHRVLFSTDIFPGTFKKTKPHRTSDGFPLRSSRMKVRIGKLG